MIATLKLGQVSSEDYCRPRFLLFALVGIFTFSTVVFSIGSEGDIPAANPYEIIDVSKAKVLLIEDLDAGVIPVRYTKVNGDFPAKLLRFLIKSRPVHSQAVRWEAYNLIFVDAQGQPLVAFRYFPVGLGPSAVFAHVERNGEKYRVYVEAKSVRPGALGAVMIPASWEEQLNEVCRKPPGSVLHSRSRLGQ